MINVLPEMARAHSERTALQCAERQLSYANLWQEVQASAAYLSDAGIGQEMTVAICCERSENMVIAALALHYLGAAYVPLDASFPKARLDYVFADSGAVAIIADDAGKALFADDGVKLIDVRGRAADVSVAMVEPDAERLAYILYTSGSTGKPKGVAVSSGAMLNFLQAMLKAPGFSAENTLLAVTTLAFDISVLELFLPLMVGGQVVIAQEQDLKDGAALNRLIEKHKIDVMQSTPSTFRLLLASEWGQRSRKHFKALCGGEPLPLDLRDDLIAHVGELWNMYGPTEATVWVTCKHLVNKTEPISIGTPIENTQIYILDQQLKRVAEGQEGELCIAGANLAIGYHGRPDLTEAAFIDHPEFGRIYRSGDLAKWADNGEIVHLGRIDAQVKIRGYRIELGEIEKAIIDTRLVANVAVIAKQRGEQSSDASLVACCVAEQADNATAEQIKQAVAQLLPSYMLPEHFIFLDDLPLTPNGKVDRKALNALELDLIKHHNQVGDLPRSPQERYLAERWQALIDIDAIYLDDNFFDIGGHSLLAAQLITVVQQDYGVQLPFSALTSGTLEQIASTYLAEPKPHSLSAPISRETQDKPNKLSWLKRWFN